jgi:hypothetical protein
VFRRRRSAGDRDPVQDAGADLAAEANAGPDDDDSVQQAGPRGTGPWDAADQATPMNRVDLGSLQVPVLPELDINLIFAEQHGAWVTVRYGASELQLQAFAAPKSGTIWNEVRGEIAAEINGAGGVSGERSGPFGMELVGRVPVEPGAPQSGLRPIRFVGIDGPRWFLRGLISGAAADDPAAAAPLEALLREVVVVRGEHPVPPRDLLELRPPPEAAQALAEEQARAQQEGRTFPPLNPFERGPEFTETR